MNKKSFGSILSCLLGLFVFVIIAFLIANNCIQSYINFPLHDYWIELLINYSAGPVRRGLPGEILSGISFIPIKTLWLIVIVLCYVFIYAVISQRMRKLGIPLIIQSGVYLSPLLCFCIYFQFYFVNRDIVLLAGAVLILLPISSICRNREKATAFNLLLCSTLLTVLGTAMIFFHVGAITLMVLPLVLMSFICRRPADFVLFVLLPAAVFLLDVLIIQKFMSVLSPEGMMTVLDDIKSRYPIVPGRPDESILVTLRSLGSEGQGYWRKITAENYEIMPSILLVSALMIATAIVPLVLVLSRGCNGTESVRQKYLKISAIAIASLAPMSLTFVGVDYFRWRNWAFVLLLCSIIMLAGDAENKTDITAAKTKPTNYRIKYAVAETIALVGIVFTLINIEMAEVLPDYIDDAARMFKSGNNNSSITVSSYKERTMIDVPGRYWDLIMNANQTVSDVGELKKFKKEEQIGVTGLCYGKMTSHSYDRNHRRLFMSGYQLIMKGNGAFIRPPRSFGFFVTDGESRLYYPTVAYSGTADIGGYTVNISSLYDDYIVIPSYMNAEKVKVYHAMYNRKGKIIQCSVPALELKK